MGVKKSKRKATAKITSESEVTPRTVELTLKKIQMWVTGWTVTTVFVPGVMVVLALLFTAYWNRPRLSISIAKALTASYRVVRSDKVYEYRAVHDLQMECLTWLIEYSAPNDGTLPGPMKPSFPRVVYGIYLENLGRSELTDIRLTFSSQAADFEITASPQLSLTQSEHLDPGGQPFRTVTVASIAPGAAGVVMGALRSKAGRFSVEPTGDANFTISYSVDEVNHTSHRHSHVRFAGARELSDTPITIMSVDELFKRQQAAFGLDALALPIEQVELSATAENFKLRGPFMVCPSNSLPAYFSSRVFRRMPEVTGSQAR
jgi:hypothetical protein